MGKIGKIRPEQLRTAQKILRELPVKVTRCSCEEAAAFLEKDLKRAFRKGYSPKELCALFKKAGIILPERLIARYQEPAEEDEENRDLEVEKQGCGDERNSIAPPQKPEDAQAAKDTTPLLENEAKATPIPESVWHGTSPMISDKPEDATVAKEIIPTSEHEATLVQKPEPKYFRFPDGSSTPPR